MFATSGGASNAWYPQNPELGLPALRLHTPPPAPFALPKQVSSPFGRKYM